MRFRYFCTLSALVATMLFSCKSNTNIKSHDDARELFLKSMFLAEEYIDSIQTASDSISIASIVENFNNKITAVNYQFPPDTDLELSEEENDSLIRIFKRMDVTIRTRLELLSGKHSPDSIPESPELDSIQINNSVLGQATPPSHTQNN